MEAMAMDRQTADLLEQLNRQAGGTTDAAFETDIEATRAAGRDIWRAFAGDDAADCDVEPLLVDGGAGKIPARLYRPRRPAAKAPPIIVFLHGGGWSLGDLDSYDGLLRSLCDQSGAIYVSVDYRLAPEHQFPAGLEDGLEAVQWVAANADRLGGDRSRLAVMGDSAGGNLATAIALRLGSRHEVRLAAQFLLYPVLDVSRPHQAYPSRMTFGDGNYLLSRDSIDATVAWYLDDRRRSHDPFVSPLLAADLSVLPPTVLVVGGHDPLLDENVVYARRLRAAGVPTQFKCFESTIHAFLSFGVLDVARRARAYLAETIKDQMVT